MYLAQNYDVSILKLSELNLFWTENIRLFPLIVTESVFIFMA